MGQIEDRFLGEISIHGSSFGLSDGWVACDGQMFEIPLYKPLFELLGTTFGGDGKNNFGLPNLKGTFPVGTGTGDGLTSRALGNRFGTDAVQLTDANIPHSHRLAVSNQEGSTSAPENAVLSSKPAGGMKFFYDKFKDNDKDYSWSYFDEKIIKPTGGNKAHDNVPPYLAVNFQVLTSGGILPLGETIEGIPGEIRIVAFKQIPIGWALCDGSNLPVKNYPDLFSAIRFNYGGDGSTTFALPDMRGRIAVSPPVDWPKPGRKGGLEKVVLEPAELPNHDHTVQGFKDKAQSAVPTKGSWAEAKQTAANNTPANIYNSSEPTVLLAEDTVEPTGSSNPEGHDNMPPSLAVNFIIYTGITKNPVRVREDTR